MAFVYSQARWSQKKQQFPGPGAYVSQQIQEKQIPSKIKIMRLHKGRASPHDNRCEAFFEKNLLYVAKKMNQSYNDGQNNKKIVGHQSFESLKKYYQKKQAQKSKQKVLTVKSLNHQIFQTQRKSVKKQRSSNFFHKSPTYPSIKNSTKQNFYIGPCSINHPEETIHKSNKKMKPIFKSVFSKSKVLVSNQLQIRWLPQEENQNQLLGQVFRQLKCRQSRKPMSASHPFRKKQYQCQRNTFQQSYKMQLPTGIQQDEQSQFDEYSTPGPGSYDVQIKSKTTKKAMMFTQYQERFTKLQKRTEDNRINLEKSNNSAIRYKSRAPQIKVGFGKCMKRISEASIDNNFRFYQNFQTIENKGLVLKIADQLKSNNSNQQKSNEKILLMIQDQKFLKKEEKIKYLQQKLQNNKLTFEFKNRIREQKGEQIDNVDFTGQEYKTIQSNSQYINDNILPDRPGFDVCTKRWQNRQKKVQIKCRSELEIKHGLIQNINGFRQRPHKPLKKEIKAYTFDKYQDKQNTNLPVAAEQIVDDQNIWIQKTYNQKFK